MSLDLTVTDLFCGAGGSSIGATTAGARLRMAANHWQLAIDTHNANFPDADHDCADVSQVDPRRYPSTDILIASPECTNHSMAKSNKHRTDLFNPEGDPTAERSRATMWDVPRFAEQHRYQVVIVENVVEARRWPPFMAWIMAMESYGYAHRAVYLNSMTAHPTPQSRDRMYVVFWQKGNTKPDLELGADAWCPSCEKRVEGRQAFKNPHKPWGKYRSQYVYLCPDCRTVAAPIAFPALSALDMSLPCPRIGDRAKPLADATRRRVQVGLDLHGPMAVVQAGGHTYEAGGYYRAWPATQPLPVQATSIGQAVVTEPGFIVELRGGSSDARPAVDPLSTVTASGNHHAFVMKNYSGNCDPKNTVQPIIQPLGTVTTMDHHSLVTMPFTIDYHGNGRANPVSRPLPTQDTRDRHALVKPEVEVDDCGFRMLEPHEIGRAMAFPESYKVEGNKRDKVKLYGNAVTPPAMTRLVERAIASLA